MATIKFDEFSAGWIPSDDPYMGRKNGFNVMQNVQLDENGIASIVRGTVKLSPVMADYAHTLYSRVIGANFYRYAALHDGTIVRDSNRALTYGTTLITGGSDKRASFAAAFDMVFMISGNITRKDNGASNYPLGLSSPLAIVASLYATPSQINLENLAAAVYTNWVVNSGVLVDNTHNYIIGTSDVTTFSLVVQTDFSSAKNTNSFSNGGIGLPTDLFCFYFYSADRAKISNIRLQFLTGTPAATPVAGTPDTGNYYYADVIASDVVNQDGWTLIQCRRSDFIQVGDTTQGFWDKVKSIRIIVNCTAAVDCWIEGLVVQGGSNSALDGEYIYGVQEVVNANGYQTVSPVVFSNHQIAQNGIITVTPGALQNGTTTHINIYRREVNTQAQATLLKTVATASIGAFQDGESDITLLAGSSINPNLFLQNVSALTDNIRQIIGLFFGRMLYFSDSKIYISEYLCPDVIDTRLTLSYSGNSSELFLWADKVGNSTIYVGTDLDIYTISGTFQLQPNGVIDAVIRPMGVKYPPVSQAETSDNGTIIYLANDGFRSLAVYGDATQNLSQNLALLFKGYTRSNYPPVNTGFDNLANSRCVINKGKLYTIVSLIDATRRVWVFDLAKQYWYSYETDPITLFTEQDGTLVASFNDFAQYIIREIDAPSTKLTDGTTKQTISLVTPYFNGGDVNRKDTYTFKIKCNTNNENLPFVVVVDNLVSHLIGQINSDGIEDVLFDATVLNLGTTFAFVLLGALSNFSLSYIYLEYESRPNQLTRYRIPPSNLGSFGLKRTSIFPPIVLDTLGTNVTFTPWVDGVNQTPVIFNTTDKMTCIYRFPAVIQGMDFGGFLSGGLFEFYGMVQSQKESLKALPPSVLWEQIGPAEFTRWGFLERFRIRGIASGVLATYKVYLDDVLKVTSTFVTIPNVDTTYEIVVPKSCEGSTCRIVITYDAPFSRYSARFKLRQAGGVTNNKWLPMDVSK